MRIYLLLPFLIFLACTGSRMMTMDDYSDMPIGTSEKELREVSGEPYKIHKKSDGTIEYEYIEKISTGQRIIEERHYFIIIKDGRVVGKRMQQQSAPGYSIDSYDLQTTQKDLPVFEEEELYLK